MKRWAVPLRPFTHADDAFAEGHPVKIEAGHLTDWSAPGVDLVRAATTAEVKAARAELKDGSTDDADDDGGDDA